jgi:hypothetical protein
MPLDMRAGEMRVGASEKGLAERSRAIRSSQVKDGQFRFATYFVIGLLVIAVGTAVASVMPLP